MAIFDDFLRLLFHDLLLSPISHHSVWSVITAHNLTPDNRGVISIDTLHWSQLVRGYNTADTLTRHIADI